MTLLNILTHAQDNYGPKQACISFMAVSGMVCRVHAKAHGDVMPVSAQVTGDDGLSYSEHKCNEEAQVGGGGVYERLSRVKKLPESVVFCNIATDDLPRVCGVAGAANARHVRQRRHAA